MNAASQIEQRKLNNVALSSRTLFHCDDEGDEMGLMPFNAAYFLLCLRPFESQIWRFLRHLRLFK